MMLLAMPDVDELFPVELSVEAALELWLNSESSDSRVLNEFLDLVSILPEEGNCILELGCIDGAQSTTPSTSLPPTWLAILVIDLFLHFLMGVGENEEIDEFELDTGEDWLRLLDVVVDVLLER